jgi:hypothetical protein
MINLVTATEDDRLIQSLDASAISIVCMSGAVDPDKGLNAEPPSQTMMGPSARSTLVSAVHASYSLARMNDRGGEALASAPS